MDLLDALEYCGGAAPWAELRRLGVTRHALNSGVRAGRVLPVGHGGYALPDADPPVATAVRLGGVLSHASAAAWHGYSLWQPAKRISITVARGTSRCEEGVDVHRCQLTRDDVEPLAPVTAPLRTLVDCGRRLALLEAVVVLDSALRGGALSLAALREAADAARGHGSAALRQAVRFCDLRSGSELESALGVLLRLVDCEPRRQVRIAGVGDVDFLVDGWLVVEADGFEFHSNRKAYGNDRRRANALAERGYVLLRFTWEDVRFRPEWVVAQIERVRRVTPRAPVVGDIG
ncbi:MAG: DUF559 domain-containing protein [Sporichthyaceae bacterium]